MIGLGQPWLLLVALAAGVPLALHLMKRETVREHLFPSIRFILKGRVPQGGRRRLRDLLLLLLRMLAIALLALLLAKPYRKFPPDAGSADGSLAVVIVDLSASMATAQRMENARQKLAGLIAGNPRRPWHLLSSANGIVAEVGTDAGSAAARDFIANLQAGTVAGNHAKALARAAAVLAERGGTELYLVSDFQAADWHPETLTPLPDGVLPYFVSVADADAGNVGITQVRCRQAGDGFLDVAVELRNFGAAEQNRSVRMQSGRTDVRQEIAIPASDTVKTVFRIADGGSEIGVVELAGDSYGGDDSYHFWLGAPAPFRLLAVLPLQDNPTSATELFFLRKALSVTTLDSVAPYALEVASPFSFFALDLSGVDGLLLLGGAASLEDPGFKQIKTFLERGGVALCTASPDAPPRQILNLARHGLLAAQFQGMFATPDARSPEKRAVGWINQASPIGRVFENVPDSDLFILPIRQMLDIKTIEPAEDILRTEEQHPFLVRQMVGAGQFYFLTAPLTTRATDLPVSMAFLPIIREIFAARSGGMETDGIVRIDCGAPLPVRRTLAGEATPLPDDWDSLAYHTAPRAGKVAGMPVEMNVPRSESLPDRRSLVAMRIAMTGQRTAPEVQTQGGARHADLRPHAALLVMLAVLAEALLAAHGDKRERRGGSGAAPA